MTRTAANQPPALLIVDDEEPQTRALCSTLRAHGYDPAGFTSPHAALEALRRQRFDLLLTDLMMPEMDGIHLLRSALAVDGTLAVVMMTGQGTIDSAVQAMKAGALDYILKPFKLGFILPVLSRALEIRRLRAENLELTERVRNHTEELEAAYKELEAFSFSVPHELRNSLTVISGFSTMLAERHRESLPPEGRRMLDQVIGQARHMNQLIDDLLRFSRLGRQPVSSRPVAMAPLVHRVLEELRESSPERIGELYVQDLPDCLGDEALLRQVLTNLFSNAIKFTRRRKPARIEVGYRREPREIVYFVRDNGVGFDMRFASNLFGMFQRLHSQDEFEGTGIGLSIVQRIVERHGGRIWVDAAPDQGATFYFSLSAAQ